MKPPISPSDAAFHAIFRGTSDGILVHRGGRVVMANPALAVMLGYDAPAELVGANALGPLIAPEHRAFVRQRAARVLEAGSTTPADVVYLRKDGTRRTLHTTGARVDFDGVASVMVIARDATEERALRAKLMAADRLASVGTLAAGVAHEINNPLAFMSADIEVLGDLLDDLRAAPESVLFEETRQILEALRVGTERIRKIVRGLQTFAAPAQERRHVDVCALLDLSLTLVAAEIRHRGRVVRDFEDVPRVEADESQLGQVVINVLVNAAQALPEGPAQNSEIRVRTRARNGHAIIEIADTGCGIAPEARARIFDPFFTTKPVGVGTGLGLSIAHGVVTALGGTIEVESEVGAGTTVRIALPGCC